MAKDRSINEEWQDKPDEEAISRAWPIMRVGPKGVSGLIICSSHLVGRYTHYWGGRTCPCNIGDCPACDAGQVARWYGWLAAMSLKTGAKAIIEITTQGYQSADEILSDNKPLLGCLLAIQRIPQRPNGRMKVEVRPQPTVMPALPNEPDVRGILARMWATSIKQKDEAPQVQRRAEINGSLNGKPRK